MESTFKEYFDDCQIGDRVITPGRTITEADVVAFAALSGDWNAIHTDREYAAEHSPYGRRIAHGLLGLVAGVSLLSRLGWSAFWPKSLICITGLQKVRFPQPIFIGDTIHLEAEIVATQKVPQENGMITTKARIKNQRDETVISARVDILAGCRPTHTST